MPVKRTKKTKIPQTQPAVAEVLRPWGKFHQYAHNEPVTVSLMTVKPGRRLSLQAHRMRAELWIVLDSGAEIQCGKRRLRPRAGSMVWIPAGTAHRLGSRQGVVRVLEVAFGNWQQTDIIRYEDDYARPKEGE